MSEPPAPAPNSRHRLMCAFGILEWFRGAPDQPHSSLPVYFVPESSSMSDDSWHAPLLWLPLPAVLLLSGAGLLRARLC